MKGFKAPKVKNSPQQAWRDSPAHTHIDAHTPSHFKKLRLGGKVKGS
jgi:hypothetical protein